MPTFFGGRQVVVVSNPPSGLMLAPGDESGPESSCRYYEYLLHSWFRKASMLAHLVVLCLRVEQYGRGWIPLDTPVDASTQEHDDPLWSPTGVPVSPIIMHSLKSLLDRLGVEQV